MAKQRTLKEGRRVWIYDIQEDWRGYAVITCKVKSATITPWNTVEYEVIATQANYRGRVFVRVEGRVFSSPKSAYKSLLEELRSDKKETEESVLQLVDTLANTRAAMRRQELQISLAERVLLKL